MQEMTGIEARDWVLAGKSLPNNLVVEGDLNLFGCTALTTLPDNLVVYGYLDLGWCSALTSLPDNLVVNGYLDLGACTSLASLPDNLVVNGELDLSYCTALTSLPDNLVVNGELDLSYCTALKSSAQWLFPKSSLKCKYPPIGYIQDDGTLLIKAGCFSGTLEEARIRSKGRRGYLKAIDDIEAEWEARIFCFLTMQITY